MFNNVHPQDIIWMMNNIAQNQEIGDDLPEGTMRAQQGGSIGNMIRKRLAENLYPVGYSGSSVDSEGNVERFGPVTKILNALKIPITKPIDVYPCNILIEASECSCAKKAARIFNGTRAPGSGPKNSLAFPKNQFTVILYLSI